MSEENKQPAEQELDQNQKVNLELPLGAVNYILSVISEKPYKDSAGLINMIHQQVIPQVQASQEPPAA